MDAQPELALIAKALNEHGLEGVLIGNMGAAIHGAPVSTVDIDFYFRQTPRNLAKLKRVADALRATILRPFYPVSAMFRLQREDDGLQIDFMGHIDGATTYKGVRRRATVFPVGGYGVLVASLADIIDSKKAAGREKDTAVISILERTLHEESATRHENIPLRGAASGK